MIHLSGQIKIKFNLARIFLYHSDLISKSLKNVNKQHQVYSIPIKMKLKCALSHCQNTEDLIRSPVEPQLLLQWQNVLSMEENEFHVCHLHFDESSFEIKKVLKQNAVPTMLFDHFDENNFCECCFKTFSDVDAKFRIGQQLQDVIRKLLQLQVKCSFRISLDKVHNLYSGPTSLLCLFRV